MGNDFSSVLSNQLDIRWDEEADALLINYAGENKLPEPLIRIRAETIQDMTLAEASEFIGSRVLLMMPGLRALFGDEIGGK